jgi:5-methylcytosine-specific restriction endonuclease McrA
MQGEHNPNWNNGSSFKPYALGWTETYKEQIRYRDGYKCQLCGMPEIENGKKLSVHHKDYNKKNILPDNLVSLCSRCHNITNQNRKYWMEVFNVNKSS